MGLTLTMRRLPPSQIPLELDSRQGPVQSYSRIDKTFVLQLASGLLLTEVLIHDDTTSGLRGVCVCVCVYV